MGFFDNLGKTISDASQSALQKGKEIADVAKLSSAISEEERKITDIYVKMGKLYMEKFADSPEEGFAESINAIKEAKAKIEDLQQKINTLKGIVKCPNCGGTVPANSTFCTACGTKLEVAKPEAEPIEKVEGEVIETVICSACGAKVIKGNKFCTACGAPLTVSEEKTEE